MDKENCNQSSNFVNKEDENIKVKILNLDKKLKDMLAEIDAKLDHSALDANAKKLTLLREEIELAIEGLNSLVNLLYTQDADHKSLLKQTEELQKLIDSVSH